MMSYKKVLFPIVYIDLDDVLGETLRTFVDALQKHFGIVVNFEDIFSFHLNKSFGLNPEQYNEFMRMVHEPKVLLSIVPMKGATEVINEWKSRAIHIAIITGRPISTLETSKIWLKENKIPFDSISVIDKYGREKASTLYKPLGIKTIAKSNFFLAIEDSYQMASFITKKSGIPVALLDRPWNRKISRLSDDIQHLIIRCQDWNDIGNKFRQLTEKNS